jgi:hypothetical protein
VYRHRTAQPSLLAVTAVRCSAGTFFDRVRQPAVEPPFDLEAARRAAVLINPALARYLSTNITGTELVVDGGIG